MELNVAKEVTTSTIDDTIQYVPPSGKKFEVQHFCGSACFSKNSCIRLVWKYDHSTDPEEQIWTIKGEAPMPHTYHGVGDGVSVLAVLLDNAEGGDVYMSGHVDIWVEP